MEHSPLDVVWILLCTVLVIIMQPGFTFFETGLIRAKNSVSVAIKNIADFCVVGTLFGVFGFGLMFGTSAGGFIGTSGFFFDSGPTAWHQAFMLFQLSFCATSITIISGAVAERIRFAGYLIVSAITASVVYPVVGHWIWAGQNDQIAHGWLETMGFMDFAGATTVHALGGSAALAAILIIGPRLGRFDRRWSEAFTGHNLTFTAAGTFLLIMGWLGFNGGSLLAANELLPLVFLNTFVGAAAGGVAAGLAVYAISGMPHVIHIMTGILGGLVAVTASCNSISTFDAAIIAAIGAWISLAGVYLLEKLKIDDPVGAVPVHLFGGVWGTIAVAIFSEPNSLAAGQGRFHQLIVQFTGVSITVSYSFCVVFFSLWVINKFFPLRASAEIERMGLNLGEHGSKSDIDDLTAKMQAQHRANDFRSRLEINPFSEVSELGLEYNRVLDSVHLKMETLRTVERKLREYARTDGLTQLANREFFDATLAMEWNRACREKTPISLIFADIDHFKEYNDCFGHQAGDICLVRVSRVIAATVRRPSDFVARYGGEEFVLILPNTDSDGAVRVAEQIRAAVQELKLPRSVTEVDDYVTISLGVASVVPVFGDASKSLLQLADCALYDAKQAGRNRVLVAGPATQVKQQKN